MAKSNKTILIISGVGVALLGVYLLTKKTTAPTTTTPIVLPAGQTATSTGSSILSTLTSLATSLLPGLFGSGGAAYSPVTTPLASTTTPVTSPAGGINYINPGDTPSWLNTIGIGAGDSAGDPESGWEA